MSGPVPKRSTERRRRNKVPGETTVPMDGVVAVPALPDGLHPVAVQWYESLRDSGQAQYYEPSDWAAACYVAEVMSKNLEAGRFSAQLFAVVWSAMNDLLTTEASRRKVRMEVERPTGDDVDDPKVTAMDKYKERLG